MCPCKGKIIKSTWGNSSRERRASIQVTFLAEITHWALLNNVIWKSGPTCTHRQKGDCCSVLFTQELRQQFTASPLRFFYQEHCCRRFNYQKQMEDRNESLKECNILPQTSALAEAVNVMSSDIFIQRAVLDDPIPIRRWKIMLAIRKVLK